MNTPNRIELIKILSRMSEDYAKTYEELEEYIIQFAIEYNQPTSLVIRPETVAERMEARLISLNTNQK